MSLTTFGIIVATAMLTLVFAAYYVRYWVRESFEDILEVAGPIALFVTIVTLSALPLQRRFLMLRSFRRVVRSHEGVHQVRELWDQMIQRRVELLLHEGYPSDEARAKALGELQQLMLKMTAPYKR